MADHEVSMTMDVAANILFDYVTDLGHLPEYLPGLSDVHRAGPEPAEAQGLEARLPNQPVHEEFDVAATPAGEAGTEVHSDAWIDILEEHRTLRWGVPGPHDYHGELTVHFVADETSQLTVRLHTTHTGDIDAELRRTLDTIKSSVEHLSEQPSNAPGA